MFGGEDGDFTLNLSSVISNVFENKENKEEGGGGGDERRKLGVNRCCLEEDENNEDGEKLIMHDKENLFTPLKAKLGKDQVAATPASRRTGTARRRARGMTSSVHRQRTGAGDALAETVTVTPKKLPFAASAADASEVGPVNSAASSPDECLTYSTTKRGKNVLESPEEGGGNQDQESKGGDNDINNRDLPADVPAAEELRADNNGAVVQEEEEEEEEEEEYDMVMSPLEQEDSAGGATFAGVDDMQPLPSAKKRMSSLPILDSPESVSGDVDAMASLEEADMEETGEQEVEAEAEVAEVAEAMGAASPLQDDGDFDAEAEIQTSLQNLAAAYASNEGLATIHRGLMMLKAGGLNPADLFLDMVKAGAQCAPLPDHLLASEHLTEDVIVHILSASIQNLPGMIGLGGPAASNGEDGGSVECGNAETEAGGEGQAHEAEEGLDALSLAKEGEEEEAAEPVSAPEAENEAQPDEPDAPVEAAQEVPAEEEAIVVLEGEQEEEEEEQEEEPRKNFLTNVTVRSRRQSTYVAYESDSDMDIEDEDENEEEEEEEEEEGSSEKASYDLPAWAASAANEMAEGNVDDVEIREDGDSPSASVFVDCQARNSNARGAAMAGNEARGVAVVPAAPSRISLESNRLSNSSDDFQSAESHLSSSMSEDGAPAGEDADEVSSVAPLEDQAGAEAETEARVPAAAAAATAPMVLLPDFQGGMGCLCGRPHGLEGGCVDGSDDAAAVSAPDSESDSDSDMDVAASPQTSALASAEASPAPASPLEVEAEAKGEGWEGAEEALRGRQGREARETESSTAVLVSSDDDDDDDDDDDMSCSSEDEACITMSTTKPKRNKLVLESDSDSDAIFANEDSGVSDSDSDSIFAPEDEADGLSPGKEMVFEGGASELAGETSDRSCEAMKKFQSEKESLVKALFAEYNRRIFQSKLPSDLQIKWNPSLQTTAGITKYSRKYGIDGRLTYTASVELSSKVVDCESRLKQTFCHELCHVAAWLVDHIAKPPHGPVFKNWADKAMQLYPDLNVSTW